MLETKKNNSTTAFVRSIIPGSAGAPLDLLLALALSVLPLFHLTVKHWTNGWLAVLGGFGAFKLVSGKRGLKDYFPNWQSCTIGITLCMPLIAVLFAQAVRGQFVPNYADAPSRFFLAGIAFIGLRSCRAQFLHAFRIICPISIFCCLASVKLFPAASIKWGGRLATYVADCNAFGDHIVLLGALTFLMHQLAPARSIWMRGLNLLSIATAGYLAIGAQTRGAWLAIPFVLVFWGYLERNNPTKILRVACVFVLLFAGVMLLSPEIRSRFLSTFSEFRDWATGTNVDTSGGLRLVFWKIALVLFQQKPIGGYGDYEQFRAFLHQPAVTNFANNNALMQIENGPHNELLANALRSGAFGLLASLGLFFGPALVFWNGLQSTVHSARLANAVGLCTVVCFFAFGITLEVFTLKFCASFYGFLIAMLAAEGLQMPSTTDG
jgi:O-antigen ligase